MLNYGRMAKLLGKVTSRGVAGDFIVLNALSCADQGEVSCRVVLFLGLGDHFFALRDEAHHALTRLGPTRLAKDAEAFFQPCNLLLGLLQVLLKEPLQLRSAGG